MTAASPLLLDTNVCIEILKGRSDVVKRFRRCDPSELRLCSVVKAELYFGAHSSLAAADNIAAIERFVAPFRSLPFDDACARSHGRVRADLRRRGMPIGANDTLIAAIALTHGLTLVSHNTREFGRVPGLRLEDWQTEA